MIKIKKSSIILFISALLFSCSSAPENPCAGTGSASVAACAQKVSGNSPKFDVAAIIWPAYQNEPRWKELGIFAHGCGEWQNVYEGKPRFEGHYQPMVPYWGYGLDDDPVEMSRQIDAALAAGINVFIYDWYWYQGRPFLENALNNGFLKAPNNERMKFYLMWANHNVNKLWNNKEPVKKMKNPYYRAAVSYEEFTKVLVPRFIEYFKKPNYYKIDGKPVFMLYDHVVFASGLGGTEKARQALQYFRDEVKKAGFKGLHLQVPFAPWQPPLAIPGSKKPTWGQYYRYLGVDSATCYNWNSLAGFNATTAKDDIDYEKYGDLALSRFDEIAKLIECPFIANVTTGWDNNARYPESVRTKITLNKTPQAYERFLRKARNWAEKNSGNAPRLIIINAWNEWTEGGYLMPDKKFGYGFLNATARVFNNTENAAE